MTDKFQDSEYLTAAQVRARFGGASRMWLHRRLTTDAFPPPVRFGPRFRYWRLADIKNWEAAMIQRGITAPKVSPKNKRA